MNTSSSKSKPQHYSFYLTTNSTEIQKLECFDSRENLSHLFSKPDPLQGLVDLKLKEKVIVRVLSDQRLHHLIERCIEELKNDASLRQQFFSDACNRSNSLSLPMLLEPISSVQNITSNPEIYFCTLAMCAFDSKKFDQLVQEGIKANLFTKENSALVTKNLLIPFILGGYSKLIDFLVSTKIIALDDFDTCQILLDHFNNLITAIDTTHCAYFRSYLIFFESYSQKNLNLTPQTNQGETILHLIIKATRAINATTRKRAFRQADKICLQSILQTEAVKAILDIPDQHQLTALDYAFFEEATLLLEAGATPILHTPASEEIRILVDIFAEYKNPGSILKSIEGLAIPVAGTPLTKLQSQIDIKNLAHFMGDPIIKKAKNPKAKSRGEGLEGNSGQKSLQFITSLLELLAQEQNGLTPEKKTQLAQAAIALRFPLLIYRLIAFFQALETEIKLLMPLLERLITKQLQELPAGQSVLIPSGWTNAPTGHLMLCEFKKNEEGDFQLNLFNSGAGATHHEAKIEGAKWKISPALSFNPISLDELQEGDFLKALLTPLVIPTDKVEKYSEKDIYQAIFQRFATRRMDTTKLNSSLKITLQRAGACSMQTPMAFLHYFLGSETHKEAFLEARLRVLEICSDAEVAQYNSLKAQDPEVREWRKKGWNELMLFALQSLSRNILKRNRTSPELENDAYQRLQAIFDKREFSLSKEPLSEPFKLPSIDQTHTEELQKLVSVPLITPSFDHAEPPVFTLPPPAFSLLHFDTPDSAGQFLFLLQYYYEKACGSDSKLLRSFALDNLASNILKIPLPPSGSLDELEKTLNVWHQMETGEVNIKNTFEALKSKQKSQHKTNTIDFALINLNNLLQLLSAGMLREKSCTFSQILALYQLTAIIWRLGCLKEKAKPTFKQKASNLDSYGVDISHLKAMRNTSYQLPASPKEDEQLSRLISFFEKSHPSQGSKEKTLFQFGLKNKFGEFKSYQDPTTGDNRYLETRLNNTSKEQLASLNELYDEYEISEGKKAPTAMKPDLKSWQLAYLWTHQKVKGEDTPTFYQVRDAFLTCWLTSRLIHRGKQVKGTKATFDVLGSALQYDEQAKEVFITFGIGLSDSIKEEMIGYRDLTNSLSLNEELWTISLKSEFEKFLLQNETPDQQNEAILDKHKYQELHEIVMRKNLRLEMLLEYFSFHRDKLLQSDMQNFFLTVLFSQGVLVKEIKENPKCALNLIQFLESAMDEFRSRLSAYRDKDSLNVEQLIGGYFFLSFLAFQVSDYASSLQSKEDFTYVREKLKEQLKKWIKTPPDFPWLESRAVQAQARLVLLNSYGDALWNDPSSVEQFFCHAVKWHYQKHRNSPYETKYPEATFKAKLLEHSEDLGKLFSDPLNKQRICNAVLKEHGIVVAREPSDWQGNYPLYATKIGNNFYELYLPEGVLLKNKQEIQHPRQLVFNKTYEELFGSTELSELSVVDGTGSGEFYQGKHPLTKEIYQFEIDKKGLLKIFKIISGQNYQYVSWQTSGLSSVLNLPKAPNYAHYHCWKPSNSTQLLVEEKSSGKIVMEITSTGQIRLPNQIGSFELINIKDSKEWKKLAEVDDLNEMSVFKSSGSSSSLSHPGYMLTFNRLYSKTGELLVFKQELKKVKNEKNIKTEQPKFVWEENPHYFIDEESNIEMLGITKNPPLVVRDKKGNRKAILPLKCIADYRQSEKSEFAETNYPFEVIDIDKKGLWSPSQNTQSLLLAYRFLAEGDYVHALQMLKKTNNLQPFKAEELQLFGWIFMQHRETKDYRPEAQAVRLYAAWLVHQNQRRHPPSLSPEPVEKSKLGSTQMHYSPVFWEKFWHNESEWKKEGADEDEGMKCVSIVSQAYNDYCQIASHLPSSMRLDNDLKQETHKLLTPAEELDWLFALLKQEPDFFVAGRAQYLLGESSSEPFFMPTPIKTKKLGSIDLFTIKSWMLAADPLDALLESNWASNNPLEHQALIKLSPLERILTKLSPLRPGDELKNHYGALFKIALSDNAKDKKRLLQFLEGMRFEKDPTNRAFFAIAHAFCTDWATLKPELQDPTSNLKTVVTGIIKDRPGANSYQLKQALNGYIEAINAQGSPIPKEFLNLFAFSETSIPDTLMPQVPVSAFNRLELTLEKDQDRTEFHEQLSPYFEKPSEPQPHPIFWHLTEKLKQDPYYIKRHAELKEGFLAGCTENDKNIPFQLRKDKTIANLKPLLLEKVQSKTKQVDHLKQAINELTEKLPQAPDAKMRAHLKILGHLIVPASFETLSKLFAQGSMAGYAEALPFLDEKQIKELHNLLGSYFLHATDLQLYKKTLAHLENAEKLILKKGPEQKIQESLDFCGQCLNAKRGYDPNKYPALALFEYFSGFNLRSEQTGDVSKLSTLPGSIEEGYDPLILQRIMSAGKTVVYGTLLLLLKADGYHLSISVLPASLFETNAQDMLQRSESYFGQKGHVVVFKRGPEYMSYDYLRNLHYLCLNTIQERGYIMVTLETIESMQNAYVESLQTMEKQRDDLLDNVGIWTEEQMEMEKAKLNEQVRCHEELKQILVLFKERGAATFDEVDMACSPKKELNFPTLEVEHLDPTAVSLVAELFKLATDPDIVKLGLELHRNTQARLLPHQYAVIREKLGQKMSTAILASQKFKSRLSIPESVSQQQLVDFFTKKDQITPQWILDLGNSKIKHEQLSAEYLILVRQELLEWLPEAWKSSADEHYGRSLEFPHIQVAKPNLAANTPNEKAEISDPWETVNKTFQLYISKGLDPQQMKKFGTNLCHKALDEWREGGSLGELKKTETCQLFAKAFQNENHPPLDLFDVNFDSSEIRNLLYQQLQKGSVAAIKLILDFVSEEIFPEHQIFVEQISNNPQNGAAAVESFQGYSGTIENRYIFHHSLTHKDKILPDKSSNGRVLDVLLLQNRVVDRLENERMTAGELLKTKLDPLSAKERNQFHALIDLGVLFKGYNNQTVASSIMDYFSSKQDSKIEGVLFYDSTSNELAFLKKGSSKPITLPGTDAETIATVTGLKPEQLFTYYDHRHITGSNIAQEERAKAIATFSESVTLRDLLQAVMRMRKLLLHQHVEFVYPKDLLRYVSALLGEDIQTLTIETLLLFCEINGYEQEKKDNLRVAYQKMHEQIVTFVREICYAETDFDLELDIYKKCKSIFIKSMKESLFSKYGINPKSDDTDKVLTNLKMELLNLLKQGEPPIKHDLSVLEKNFDEVIAAAVLHLPEKLPVKKPDFNQGGTVENVQEARIEKQSLQEQEQDRQRIDQSLLAAQTFKPANAIEWPTTFETLNFSTTPFPIKEEDGFPAIWRLSDYLRQQPAFSKFASIFPPEIQMTENFLNTRKGLHDLFNDSSKKSHQILILKNRNGQYRSIFLSIPEGTYFKKLLRKNHRENVWLIDSLHVIAPKDAVLDESNPQLMDLLTITKLCSNSWQLLHQPKYESSLKSVTSQHKRKWRDLLEIAILDDTERVHYRDSKLQVFLNDIKNKEDETPEDIENDQWENFLLTFHLLKLDEALKLFEKFPPTIFTNHPERQAILWKYITPFLTPKAIEHEFFQQHLAKYLEVINPKGIVLTEQLPQLLNLFNFNLTPAFIKSLGNLLIPLIDNEPTLARGIASNCIHARIIEKDLQNPQLERKAFYTRSTLIYKILQKCSSREDLKKSYDTILEEFNSLTSLSNRSQYASPYVDWSIDAEPLLTQCLNSKETIHDEFFLVYLAQKLISSKKFNLESLILAKTPVKEIQNAVKKIKPLLFNPEILQLFAKLEFSHFIRLGRDFIDEVLPLAYATEQTPSEHAKIIIQILQTSGIPYAEQKALTLKEKFNL